MYNFYLYKLTFLHLKELENLLREPPDCTGNESTSDKPIGSSVHGTLDMAQK